MDGQRQQEKMGEEGEWKADKNSFKKIKGLCPNSKPEHHFSCKAKIMY